MTRPGWFAAVFAPAVAVAAAAWSAPARPGVTGTPVEPASAVAAAVVVGQPLGQASCASTGCHGGPAGDALRNGPSLTSWDSSAVVWAAADPHRNAHAVLDGPLARDMMKRLGGGDATKDVRCLACHTNPALSDATDAHSVALRAEGVSCEACHGNASGWLRPHTSGDTVGMVRLNNLGERALACVGCHVGAPARVGVPVRDMNHDMIAAGHPRLNFDFATYQFLLPKHWYERDRRQPGSAPDPNFEARAWLVGRVAHAEAACRLTADRQKRAAPWPEFAESSCVACHHTIAGEATTYPKPTGDRRPGSLPWQPIWPVTRPHSLAGIGAYDDISQTYGAIERLFLAVNRPRPRADTGDRAHDVGDKMMRLRRYSVELSGPAAFAAAEGIVRRATEIPPADWDRDLTEQVYHAAAALGRARMARGEPTNPTGFAAAAEALTLPRGTVRFDLPPGAADVVKALLK